MLLGVEATDAAKDAIQKLGFVHTVTCCPGICPGTQKLLRHRNGQREGKRAHNFKGLNRKIRGKLRVVGFDSLPNCFRNVVWVKPFKQKTGEHTLEFEFLSRRLCLQLFLRRLRLGKHHLELQGVGLRPARMPPQH